MKIEFGEISVVVQGAISDCTRNTLQSIRKFMPGSKIILSTWEGSQIDGLSYDILVLNKDPGNTPCYRKSSNVKKDNNVNRQIVSTINGLKKVCTKYSLKIRTDFEVKHTGFIQWFNKFPRRNNVLNVFENKLVSYSACLKDMIFHPCDFMFFGLTSDLVNLFDIPLQSHEDAFWFEEGTTKKMPYPFISRFAPEQYIWIECLKKKYPEVMKKVKDLADINDENRYLSIQSFLNNFIGIDCQFFGVEPLKKGLFYLNRPIDTTRQLSTSEFMSLYKKEIDNNYVVPFKIKIIENFCYKFCLRRFLFNVYRFIMKICYLPFIIFFPSKYRKQIRKKLNLKK